MGFGRGKGFTSKVRTETTKYAVKGGGGKKTATAAETSPTYTVS
uniref:Uncharacterized protein n=1 Tax=viral metagenome TaxID=1070528 RepID=A0A6M3XYE9_9ZZZZ